MLIAPNTITVTTRHNSIDGYFMGLIDIRSVRQILSWIHGTISFDASRVEGNEIIKSTVKSVEIKIPCAVFQASDLTIRDLRSLKQKFTLFRKNNRVTPLGLSGSQDEKLDSDGISEKEKIERKSSARLSGSERVSIKATRSSMTATDMLSMLAHATRRRLSIGNAYNNQLSSVRPAPIFIPA